MTLVRIVIDDDHQVQVHEYEAGPGGVPRVGDYVDFLRGERRVRKVVWDFLKVTHGVGPDWATVLVEPHPDSRDD